MAIATPAPERAAGRRALAARKRALSDGSFPVPDGAYWDKARQAIGRVRDPAKRAQVAKLLRKTAPQVGRTQALKNSWAAPGGSQHANGDTGIYLAETARDDQGLTLTCPECNYTGPVGRFGTSGAPLQARPGGLQTPAPSTAGTRDGVPLTVRGGPAAHALANGGTRAAVELAAGLTRHPIRGPMDVLVARAGDGTAVLKHRHGGAEIARLRKTPEGKWQASVAGRDLTPRDHQRTALMEAVGTWNGALQAAARRAEPPLQPAPVQTPLMAEYGIPAMRSAAFATPAAGTSDGPRTAGADDGGDTSGLNPKGQAIYKKLIARGFPPARALAFARNAQDAQPGKFTKAGQG